MKKGLVVLLLSLAALGCKQQMSASERAELEKKLMTTMQEYLQKNNGKPTVTFTVTDVAFFSEKDHHTCEFNVSMHFDNRDTSGKMKAFISKDFKTVTRLY